MIFYPNLSIFDPFFDPFESILIHFDPFWSILIHLKSILIHFGALMFNFMHFHPISSNFLQWNSIELQCNEIAMRFPSSWRLDWNLADESTIDIIFYSDFLPASGRYCFVLFQFCFCFMCVCVCVCVFVCVCGDRWTRRVNHARTEPFD